MASKRWLFVMNQKKCQAKQCSHERSGYLKYRRDTQPKTFGILMKQGAFREHCLKRNFLACHGGKKSEVRIIVALFVDAAGNKQKSGNQQTFNALSTSKKHSY